MAPLAPWLDAAVATTVHITTDPGLLAKSLRLWVYKLLIGAFSNSGSETTTRISVVVQSGNEPDTAEVSDKISVDVSSPRSEMSSSAEEEEAEKTLEELLGKMLSKTLHNGVNWLVPHGNFIGNRMRSGLPAIGRTILTTTQIMTSFKTTLKVPWPPLFFTMVSWLGSVFNWDVVSLPAVSCWFPGAMHHQKMLATCLGIVGACALLGLLYLVGRVFNHGWIYESDKKTMMKEKQDEFFELGETYLKRTTKRWEHIAQEREIQKPTGPLARQLEDKLVAQLQRRWERYKKLVFGRHEQTQFSMLRNYRLRRFQTRVLSLFLFILYLTFPSVSKLIIDSFGCEDMTDVAGQALTPSWSYLGCASGNPLAWPILNGTNGTLAACKSSARSANLTLLAISPLLGGPYSCFSACGPGNVASGSSSCNSNVTAASLSSLLLSNGSCAAHSSSWQAQRVYALQAPPEVATSYLRADYRIVCHGSSFDIWVKIASFWVAVFPVGVPVLFWTLLMVNDMKRLCLRRQQTAWVQVAAKAAWRKRLAKEAAKEAGLGEADYWEAKSQSSLRAAAESKTEKDPLSWVRPMPERYATNSGPSLCAPAAYPALVPGIDSGLLHHHSLRAAAHHKRGHEWYNEQARSLTLHSRE